MNWRIVLEIIALSGGIISSIAFLYQAKTIREVTRDADDAYTKVLMLGQTTLALQIDLATVRAEAKEAQSALATQTADALIEQDARKRAERHVQQLLKEIVDNGDPKRVADLVQQELALLAKIGKT